MSSVFTIHDIEDEEFIDIVKNSTTWREILKKCGYKSLGNYKPVRKRCQNMNIDISHLPSGQGDNKHLIGKRYTKYKIEEILVENSTYMDMVTLKKRLIKEKDFEYKCYNCNLTEWINKPIPLEIEHINGIHTDNRIENLTFLCCNCHALTDTYKGKNVKNKVVSEKNKCEKCDKVISRGSTYCLECIKFINRKVERPSYEELLEHINNKKTMVELGQIYGVTDRTIKNWIVDYEKNLNIISYKENINSNDTKEENKCKKCSKFITPGAKYCQVCISFNNRKVERPSYEELLGHINNKVSLYKLGKIYGVSDGTIKNWITKYEKELNKKI